MATALERQQTAAREEQVWKLKLQGRTEREIALTVGLTQSGVHQIVQRVEQRVLADVKATVLRIKGRQHARLEYIFAEAMAGYERSQRTAEREVQEAKSGPASRRDDGTVVPGQSAGSKIQRVKEGRDGDPVWLNTALSAHDRMCKLWGLDAPVKVQQVREPTAEEQFTSVELLAAVEREIAEERQKLAQGADDE